MAKRQAKSTKPEIPNLGILASQSLAEIEAKAEQLRRITSSEVMLKTLKGMTEEKRSFVVAKMLAFRELYRTEKARADYISFVREMMPGYIHGYHFDVLADVFQRIDRGERVRCIINIPPRHGKSKQVSVAFPAWYIGRHPDHQIIQASCKKELAEQFGGELRNMIASEDYTRIFPGVELSYDSKAKGRWATNHGGQYYATGTGGSVIGKGAHILIVDDPHGETTSISSGDENTMPSREDFDKDYNWFLQTLTRLMPNGSVLVVMQRWNNFDIVGRIRERMLADARNEQWEIVEIPALLQREDERGDKLFDEEGEPLWDPMWPEFWSLKDLLALKQEMPAWRWQAQYMQNPQSSEASIIKRKDWKIWGKRPDGSIDFKAEPPKCEFVIQAWDTAHSAKTMSDYSACTTWGVFRRHQDEGPAPYALILLDAWKGQLDFPALKRKVLEKYRKFEPDACIIEAKASGTPIIQEFRAMGVPIQDYTPTRQTGDKVVRLNSVAELFTSGLVFVPMLPFADDVINEVSVFPHGGRNDDYVDTVSMALNRFRRGGFITLTTDEPEEEEHHAPIVRYF